MSDSEIMNREQPVQDAPAPVASPDPRAALTEKYRLTAAEYGDALWRLKGLQAYIADAEARIKALEAEFAALAQEPK